ncbi:hypothetical protein [Jannaschia donghaensis]|uniref:VOC domain-containing protein n=1 Tax=Jannaschia donghaensis TaxID=420998 RepID=A0A0M6YG58_9RHOB|nr:hypothetical protein [Jannaschia donghaensis]CTQ48473.1 hypothetical protein JDO7802_00475 [Jannaschia donghaensis]
MTLLHASIAARAPAAMARTLAMLLGGSAHPFPPCPGAWIAFADADDGTAVEVYPAGTRLKQGKDTVVFEPGPPRRSTSATHLAIASPLDADVIIAMAQAATWTARICDRGPFTCVEIWTGEGVMIEVLDPEMLAHYRTGMTAARWRAMFGD